MKCAVLDTNVLISAFGWDGNEARILEAALLGRVKMAASPFLIEEFRRVALRPRMGFNPEKVEAFLSKVLEVALLVNTRPTLRLLSDIADNRVLECAAEAKADFIVTGDSGLLALKSFKKTRIVSSKDFLALIGQSR